MAKSHVIDYKDGSGRAFKLDINNGHVYDASGAEVTKLSVMDRTQDQTRAAILADYCAEFSAANLALASSNGDREQAKAIFSSARESSIRMDLGTGDVHQAASLPNYAAGYANAPPMADVVSPALLVPKPSDKYYTFAKEDAFQTANPSVGAPGGQVAEISPRLSNATFTTVEYALGGFVSSQIEAAADAPLKIRQATARRIMQALMLNRELRVSTMLTTAANWASANVGDLTAAGAAYKWNAGASSDPVNDLMDRMEASWGECSGILMPFPVYNAFVRNNAVRAFYAYKNNASPIPGPAEISALLQLPPIYVAKMQAMSSSTAKSYIWGNDVVLFRQPPQMPPASQDDVATSYTFRWSQSGSQDASQSSGGFIVREFFNQNRGSQGGNMMVVIHQDVETMTSTYVGGVIKGAYQ